MREPDPEFPQLADEEKRKYPISFREGLTVFVCLGVSLAAIMALVIYVGFFWYLEQQRQLKGKTESCELFSSGKKRH